MGLRSVLSRLHYCPYDSRAVLACQMMQFCLTYQFAELLHKDSQRACMHQHPAPCVYVHRKALNPESSTQKRQQVLSGCWTRRRGCAPRQQRTMPRRLLTARRAHWRCRPSCGTLLRHRSVRFSWGVWLHACEEDSRQQGGWGGYSIGVLGRAGGWQLHGAKCVLPHACCSCC
jgi:hypothetical protein